MQLTGVSRTIHLENDEVVHNVNLTYKLPNEESYFPQRVREIRYVYKGNEESVNAFLASLLETQFPVPPTPDVPQPSQRHP